MKRIIIATVAMFLMSGSIIAQDNKVKVVKKNTKSIKCANKNEACAKAKACELKEAEKSTCQKVNISDKKLSGKGTVANGKSLKLQEGKKFSGKAQKTTPIKKLQTMEDAKKKKAIN